jgi:hypothetical protein
MSSSLGEILLGFCGLQSEKTGVGKDSKKTKLKLKDGKEEQSQIPKPGLGPGLADS